MDKTVAGLLGNARYNALLMAVANVLGDVVNLHNGLASGELDRAVWADLLKARDIPMPEPGAEPIVLSDDDSISARVKLAVIEAGGKSVLRIVSIEGPSEWLGTAIPRIAHNLVSTISDVVPTAFQLTGKFMRSGDAVLDEAMVGISAGAPLRIARILTDEKAAA